MHPLSLGKVQLDFYPRVHLMRGGERGGKDPLQANDGLYVNVSEPFLQVVIYLSHLGE